MTEKITEDRDFILWTILYQTRDAILKVRNAELYKYNLTFMKANVLFFIENAGGKATATELSRWMLREPHTISGLVGRLMRNGLLTRKRVPGKKNMMEITLTDKGKEAYQNSLKLESIHDLLSCLSEEERKQLYATLEKLRNLALQRLTEEKRLPFP